MYALVLLMCGYKDHSGIFIGRSGSESGLVNQQTPVGCLANGSGLLLSGADWLGVSSHSLRLDLKASTVSLDTWLSVNKSQSLIVHGKNENRPSLPLCTGKCVSETLCLSRCV